MDNSRSRVVLSSSPSRQLPHQVGSASSGLLDHYSALIVPAASKLDDMQLRGFIAVAAFVMVSEYAPTPRQRATGFLLASPMKRGLAQPEGIDWVTMLRRLDQRLDANLRRQIANPPGA
jgi:hypothetical protein